MHTENLSEIEIVQNLTLTSTMIWHCGKGFQLEANGRNMEFHIAFLVLPICLHEETLKTVLSTQRRSGLTRFMTKVSKKRENLFAIHDRVIACRSLTFESIALGIQSDMLTIDYSQAQISSNPQTLPKNLPKGTSNLMLGSEKVGAWCGRHSMEQIARILRIAL